MDSKTKSKENPASRMSTELKRLLNISVYRKKVDVSFIILAISTTWPLLLLLIITLQLLYNTRELFLHSTLTHHTDKITSPTARSLE